MQALGETTFLLEGDRLGGELAVEEIASEIDQREGAIGGELRRGRTRTYTDRHRRMLCL